MHRLLGARDFHQRLQNESPSFCPTSRKIHKVWAKRVVRCASVACLSEKGAGKNCVVYHSGRLDVQTLFTTTFRARHWPPAWRTKIVGNQIQSQRGCATRTLASSSNQCVEVLVGKIWILVKIMNRDMFVPMTRRSNACVSSVSGPVIRVNCTSICVPLCDLQAYASIQKKGTPYRD